MIKKDACNAVSGKNFCNKDNKMHYLCPMKKFFYCTFYVVIALSMHSCANVASPSGGDYDETPPKFVSGNPPMNQTQFNKNKLELTFDENIMVESPSEKVIVSPPQIKPPIIKGAGKKVTVEFQDSLQENTTYTIDFNDAVVDNNEKNPLEGFSFAFSTGDVIDSLAVSGMLLNAKNLEPMQNTVVGLHRNLDDSAFLKLPFIRTSKTNERGKFTIRNIAEGTYHLFALNDLNSNYHFDQKEEEIAFLDSVVVPKFDFSTRQDTIWKDSVTVDHIHEVQFTRFYPDSLMLLMFKEDVATQFLVKRERPEPRILSITFESSLTEKPQYRLLDEEGEVENDSLFFPQFIGNEREMKLWIRDSLVFARDTLMLEMTYQKTDSLFQFVSQTDTLRFTNPKERGKEKEPSSRRKNDKEEEEADTVLHLPTFKIKTDVPATMDVFAPLSIEFPEPVFAFDTTFVKIEIKKDSLLWEAFPYRMERDTANSFAYKIQGRWDYEKEYRVVVDSASITSIYGNFNLPVSSEFKIKPQNTYSHLYFNLPELGSSAFVEMLNASDDVQRRAKVREKGVLFRNVIPGKYFFRIILDENGNDIWDPGNYEEKRQPERVYYYPTELELLQNWEVEQTWNPFELPIDKQKPLEVTKNKPKEKKPRELDPKRKQQQQRQQNQQQQQNQRQQMPPQMR